MKLIKCSQAYENECLSSYLYRLSIENYCDLNWILDEIDLNNTRAAYLIDRLSTSNSLSKVSELLNCSIQTIYDMTIHKFSNNFWNPNKYDTRGSNKAFKQLIRNAPVFYPICLSEKKYCRIHWYLKPFELCTFHRVELIEKCQYCSNSVNSFSITSSVCRHCGKSLVMIEPQFIKNDKRLNNQRRYYKAFKITSHDNLYNNYKNMSDVDFLNLHLYIVKLIDTIPNEYIKSYIYKYDLSHGEKYKQKLIEEILDDLQLKFSDMFLHFHLNRGFNYINRSCYSLNNIVTGLNNIFKYAKGCCLGSAKLLLYDIICEYLISIYGQSLEEVLLQLIKSMYINQEIKDENLSDRLLLGRNSQESIANNFNEFNHISIFEDTYRQLNLNCIGLYRLIVSNNPFLNIIFDRNPIEQKARLKDTRFVLLNLYIKLVMKYHISDIGDIKSICLQ